MVAQALLVRDEVGQALSPRRRSDPLLGLLVRGDEQRAGDLRRDPRPEQRRCTEGHAAPAGDDFIHRAHAVQVRVDRDHALEGLREQGADVALADHFAGREGNVLAHVGEVGAHQRELHRPQFARPGCSKPEFGELGVGLLQAAQQRHPRGQARRQAQPRLAVGEAMALHGLQRPAECGGQALGQRPFVVEGQQQRAQDKFPLRV